MAAQFKNTITLIDLERENEQLRTENKLLARNCDKLVEEVILLKEHVSQDVLDSLGEEDTNLTYELNFRS